MIRKTKFVFASLCLGLLCLGAADVLSADGLKTHTNSIGMEFVLIPAGSFMMGTDLDAEEGLTDRNVEEGFNDEWVQHSVTISTPFYLGKYEVTQAQWEAMMGDNPSKFKGPDNPVEQVSWDDVQEFIRRLNAKEGHNRYRLPTEMEWELAARGGTNTRWFFGDSENALGRYAWFDGNSGDKTHPVGRKKPNPYALYDIYGNVWEWCQDWYGNYPRTTVTDPRGPANGSDRVSRGGAWSIYAEYCQSARRYGNPPDIGYVNVGFRLALSLK